MKFIYTIVCFLSMMHAAWSQVQYQIVDADYEIPIVDANILSSDRQLLAVSDKEGRFYVESEVKFIIIQASEYEEKYIQLNPSEPILYLDFLKKLSPVEVKARNDEARNLIREVIKQQAQNHPNNLGSYRFISYNKYLVDTQPDSIRVNYEKMKETKDSSAFFAKKFFKNSSMFLWEKVEQIKHSQKYGDKTEVIAQRMSGLQNPIYEFLALRPNSYYLEEDEFNFFVVKYPNPVSKLGLKEFKYVIVDTVQSQGKSVITINFSPKVFDNAIKPLVGYVKIEEQSKSIIEFYAERTQAPFAYIQMKWKEHQGYYFPDQQYFYIQLNDPNSNVKLELGEGNVPVWLEYNSTFKDFNIPATFEKKEFKGYEYEISSQLQKSSETTLEKTRDTLQAREQNTYFKMDSLFTAENINRKIKLHHLLTRGTLPLGNKLELNVLKLFQLNQYEGFRPEINLLTNENFDPKWRIYGYIAYGFKDQAMKYGGTLSYLANPRESGNIFAQYNNDVNQIGRFQPTFFYERILAKDIINSYYYAQYYHTQRIQLGYEQDFFKNLTARGYLEWSQDQSATPYSYNFHPLNTPYTLYNGHLMLAWKPFTQYMKTPYGKVTIEQKPTYFGLHLMKSFGDLGSDFDFETAELWVNHQFDDFLGKFTLYGKAGYIWGNAPLFYNFEGGGNAKNKTGDFWKDISISGFKLFETMEPSRFYMDKYVSFHLFQSLPKIPLGKKNILPTLIYSGLWGAQDNSNHLLIPIEAPTEYYQEVGLKMNNIVGFLGMGMFYRLGNYSMGNFKDDFYWKLDISLPF